MIHAALRMVFVWSGEAVVTFRLQAHNHTYHFTLTTLSYRNKNDTSIAGYNIRLKNLSPYPKDFVPPPAQEKYQAQLEIQ